MLFLTAPSKTFIVGEYLALSGGTALIANTEPRFQLRVQSNKNGGCRGIHPMSPAGQWVRQNHVFFKNIDLEFVDPHTGLGGFGASGAQFIFVYLLTQFLQKNMVQIEDVNVKMVWEAYRQVTIDTSDSVSPSGADIVSQLLGGISYFKRQPFVSDSLSWPFKDLSFALLRTGFKIPTHDHLKEVKELPIRDFERVASGCLRSLKVVDENYFLESINEYQEILTRNELTHSNSLELLKHLCVNNNILAAKGCGAAGADVLFICFKKDQIHSVLSSIKQLNLNIVADDTMLSGATKIEFSLEPFSSSNIFELQSIGDMV